MQAAGVNTANLDSAQRDVQASIAGVAGEAQNLGKNLGTVSAATLDAGEKAETAGGLFATLRSHLGEIVTIAAAVELALKGIEFTGESLKGAEQVEASLSRVQALAAGAAGQFDNLEKAVDEAARSVNVSTQTSAQGLAALAAQGLTADQAIKALVPTLQLAKIAQEDVGTAAADVATVIKAYGTSAADTASVVDKLTAASHGAAGGLGEISAAAARLAPDAKSIGLSFDDVVSVLGLLASRGVEGERSLEGLRTLFQQLQNPTSELRGDLLALGDGTSSFAKAITALGQNTPLAKEALNNLDGSARSLVQALVQAGPGALQTFNAGLQTTTGFASKTAAAFDNNLLGAATRFGHAVDDLGEQLVKPILGPFTDELTTLAKKLDDFAGSPDFEAIRDSVKTMATDAARALDEFLGSIDWKSFAQNAETALAGLGKTLEKLAQSASTIGTVVGKASDVVGTAFHGIGAAVDTLVAAGAKVVDVGVDIAQGGASIAVGSKQAQQGLEGLHAAVESVGDEATQQASEHLQAAGSDIRDLAGAAQDAAGATTAQGEAAAAATPDIAAHAAASKGAADASSCWPTISNWFLSTSTRRAQRTGDRAFVNHLADAVDNLGGGPLQTAKKALADASKAFADLNASGAATPEQLDIVSAAVIKASADLQKLQVNAQGSGEALTTAFGKLGVASQADLQIALTKVQGYFDTIKAGSDQSAAGIANVANAFLASAQKQLAISALLDQATQDQTRRTLESQAADLGLSDKLQQLENQADKTGKALSTIVRFDHRTICRAACSVLPIPDKMQRFARRRQQRGAGSPRRDDRLRRARDRSVADFDQALVNARAQFSAVSDAAARAFDSHLVTDFFDTFDSTGAGFSRVIDAMNSATSEVNAQLTAQRTQLQGEIADINSLGTASNQGFGSFGTNADAAAAKMKNLSDLIAQGKLNAGLLGQEELQPLQQALDAATQRAQQLSDTLKQAVDSFNQTSADLQDALDQEAGNLEAIEDRRHQKALDNIKAEAQAAGKLNSQQYQQDVANENALHALKLKNLQTQNQSGGSGGSSGGGSPTLVPVTDQRRPVD